MKRCRTCLLPETFPNLLFDKHHVCNFCRGDYQKILDSHARKHKGENKFQLRKSFEEYVSRIRGTSEYDCVVLFSGGKDSIYLLYLLKEKYKLHPLALTVDNDFLSPRAYENIRNSVKRLQVDHQFLTPDHDFFKRLYRQFLLYPKEKTYSDSICDICQRVILSAGLNLAAEKNIPFVALAYSPDQAKYFEKPQSEIESCWIPSELSKPEFSKSDKQYFWDPCRYDHHPRLFLPFYALEYPGIGPIMELLANLGFAKKINLDPLRTSCKLQWVIMQLDLIKHGYNPYAWDTCGLIRMGKANRDMWFLVLTIGSWLLKHGLVRNMDRKIVLQRLELTIKEILD